MSGRIARDSSVSSDVSVLEIQVEVLRRRREGRREGHRTRAGPRLRPSSRARWADGRRRRSSTRTGVVSVTLPDLVRDRRPPTRRRSRGPAGGRPGRAAASGVATRFEPQPADDRHAPSPRSRSAATRRCASRHLDANHHPRPADSQDCRRGFQAHGIRGQFRDPVRRHTRRARARSSSPSGGCPGRANRRTGRSRTSRVRPERQPGFVLQRDADSAVGARPDRVRLEEGLTSLGRNRGILPDDGDGARCGLDAADNGVILGEGRQGACEQYGSDKNAECLCHGMPDTIPHPFWKVQPGGNTSRATCDVRRATCDVRRATCHVRRARALEVW